MYDTYVRESNSFSASREKKEVVKLSSIVNGVVSFFLFISTVIKTEVKEFSINFSPTLF